MRSFFNEEQQIQDHPDKKIRLTPGNAIPFRPAPRTVRSYGVSIKYYDKGNDVISKRVDYEIDLSVNQFKNLDYTWQLCFNKNELFINRHEPDLLSEQLSNFVMQALFPVKVDVDKENKVFRGIVNHPDIIRRWEEKVIKIKEKYTGEYTGLFIKKTSKKIQDKWNIEQALAYDMFWCVFFHPQYFNYEKDLTQDLVFEFPVFPYQNIRFSGKQVLAESYTDYNTYKAVFNADMDIPDHIKYNGKYNSGAKMRLNAEFDLDSDSGLLKYALVNWDAGSEESGDLKKIRFSVYETALKNENDLPDDKGNEMPVDDEISTDKGKDVPGKKGFWKKILG